MLIQIQLYQRIDHLCSNEGIWPLEFDINYIAPPNVGNTEPVEHGFVDLFLWWNFSLGVLFEESPLESPVRIVKKPADSDAIDQEGHQA